MHVIFGMFRLGGCIYSDCSSATIVVYTCIHVTLTHTHTQPDGVKKNLGLGELSEYERKKLMEVVVPELKANIKKAEEYCETELQKNGDAINNA